MSPPSTTRRDCDVLIIGAGICGLASAIALAQKGFSVCVLEKRLDPNSATAVKLIDNAAELVAVANTELASLQTAKPLFDEAQAMRTQVWGTRRRNVLLDTSSIASLQHLGIEIDQLPHVKQITVDWGEGRPQLCAHYASAASLVANTLPSACDFVFRRDWAAQPSIGELERLLLKRASEESAIEFIFDANVAALKRQSTHLCLSTEGKQGRQWLTKLLVVADGGRGTLASYLPIKRHQLLDESLEITVFESTRDKHSLATPRLCAIGEGGLTEHGWAGFGDNGDIATVQLSRLNAANDFEFPSYTFGREKGLQGRVLELGSSAAGSLEYTVNPLIEKDIIVAGDAAVRGSPLLGLGAQYGLYWSRLVENYADSISHSTTTAASTSTKLSDEFSELALASSETRAEFEHGCLVVLRDTVTRSRRLSDYLLAPSLIQCLRTMTLDYRPALRGGHLSLKSEFDFSNDKESIAQIAPELAAIQGLGKVTFTIDIELRVRAGRIRAVLENASAVQITTAKEVINIDHGELSLAQGDEREWRLSIRDCNLRRAGYRDTNALRSERQLEELAMCWPQAFVSEIYMGIFERFANSSMSELGPSTISIRIEGDHIVKLGPVSFQTIGQCFIAITTASSHSGEQAVTIKFHKGRAKPIGFYKLAAKLMPGSLGQVGDIQPIANAASRIAARYIDSIQVVFCSDGSGEIHYSGIVTVPLRLTSTQMQKLREQFSDPSGIAQIIEYNSAAIKSFELRHAV